MFFTSTAKRHTGTCEYVSKGIFHWKSKASAWKMALKMHTLFVEQTFTTFTTFFYYFFLYLNSRFSLMCNCPLLSVMSITQALLCLDLYPLSQKGHMYHQICTKIIQISDVDCQIFCSHLSKICCLFNWSVTEVSYVNCFIQNALFSYGLIAHSRDWRQSHELPQWCKCSNFNKSDFEYFSLCFSHLGKAVLIIMTLCVSLHLSLCFSPLPQENM